jgi:PPM family protein phosphatase
MRLRRTTTPPAGDERPGEPPAATDGAEPEPATVGTAPPPAWGNAGAAENPKADDDPPAGLPSATATIASRPGLVRPANEDAVGAFGWTAPRDAPRPVRLATHGGDPLVAVVADGLGGHRGGATASSLAVDRLLTAETALSSPEALVSVLRAVHAELLGLSADTVELRGLATTVVVIVVLPDQVLCAHVGDSRIYYVEDGLVQQLTEDDAATGSGALTQVLGGLPDTRIEPHVRALSRDLPARYLLCSDGLHGYVSREAIRDATAIADPLTAAETLIEAAYAAGAPDNVSICLLDVEPSAKGEGDDGTR